MKAIPDMPDPIGAIAALIDGLGDLTRLVGGTMTLVVDATPWSVDLDVPGGAWTQQAAANAAVTLHATTGALTALLMAPLTVPEHVAAGRLRFDGDTSRWARLGQLIGGARRV